VAVKEKSLPCGEIKSIYPALRLHLNGRGKRRLGQLYARVSGYDVGGSAESKM